MRATLGHVYLPWPRGLGCHCPQQSWRPTGTLLAGTGPGEGGEAGRTGCESQGAARSAGPVLRLSGQERASIWRGQLWALGHKAPAGEREAGAGAAGTRGQTPRGKTGTWCYCHRTIKYNLSTSWGAGQCWGERGVSEARRVRGVPSGSGPGGGSGCPRRRGWAGGGRAVCGGPATWPATPGRSPGDRVGVLRLGQGALRMGLSSASCSVSGGQRGAVREGQVGN